MLDEVLDGLLTVEQARAQYGVVIVDGAIDAEATAQARNGRKPAKSFFTLGPVRDALEAKLPPVVNASLATQVMRAPDGVRTHVIQAVRRDLAREDMAATEERAAAVLERYSAASA